MIAKQKSHVKHMLTSPEERFAFPYQSADMAEIVCALVNLGIVRLWHDGTYTLKSQDKAERWINSFG